MLKTRIMAIMVFVGVGSSFATDNTQDYLEKSVIICNKAFLLMVGSESSTSSPRKTPTGVGDGDSVKLLMKSPNVGGVYNLATDDTPGWEGSFTFRNGMVIKRSVGGIQIGYATLRRYEFCENSHLVYYNNDNGENFFLTAKRNGCLNVDMLPQAFYPELWKLGEITSVEPPVLLSMLLEES